MTIYVSAAVAVIGLIVFLAAKNNADLKRLGEISFFAGLLAFLILFGGMKV